ncbi:hypothetical protein BR93DRAFT_958513 [Coniochaeta sp. PMI_546]|nr:hypothetical protein BR93DRAFT_958513 [Coniochaeta sp. PMI_546]
MTEVRSKDRETAKDVPRMEPKYEIYVRLPFNRGDFVDPPPVDWNDSKSDALWNIISDVERTERKIDWNELAISFGVGVDFLLMMAQTLAERHTNQLMGLFRKAAVATGASGAASPVNAGFPSGISAQDTTASGESMKRAASGTGNRPSSPTSIRRDSPLPRTSIGTPGAGTPIKSSLAVLRPPVISRTATPSNTTTVATQNLASAAPQELSSSKPQAGPRSPLGPHHRPSTLHLSTTSPPPPQGSRSPEPSSPAKSESSTSSSSSSPVESRIIKRPPRSGPKPGPTTSIFPDDDEDEAEPAFLPYKSPPPAPAASAGSSDLGATLRGAPSRRPAPPPTSKAAATAFLPSRERSTLSDRHAGELRESQTSDSSASSTAQPQRGHHLAGRGKRHPPPPGPLSPRRTAELAGRSPAGKGKGREGSDGTPSMGSSFSDLDDASVTQSALEEALASNMQDGGATVGSRMSTFGNAFKSRYLPKSNR